MLFRSFVSFVGIPDLDQVAEQPAGRRLPQFVVVTSATPALQTFFENRLVTVAIVPRGLDLSEKAGGAQTPRDWFDSFYQVVTVDDWASPTRP